MGYTLKGERAYIGKESAAMQADVYRLLAKTFDDAGTTTLEDKGKIRKLTAQILADLKQALFKHAFGTAKLDETKVLVDDILAMYFGVNPKEFEKAMATGNLTVAEKVLTKAAQRYEGNLHRGSYTRLDEPEKEAILSEIEKFLKRKFKKDAKKELVQTVDKTAQLWSIYEKLRTTPEENIGTARKQYLEINEGLESLLETEN